MFWPNFLYFKALIRGFIVITLFFLNSSWATPLPLKGLDLLTEKPIVMQHNPNKKGLALIFLSARCPCSNSHIDILKNLKTQFKDFDFIGIHSNQDEPLKLAQDYFQKTKLPFSVIHDPNAKIADQLGAVKTPHVFLLGPDQKIWFQGGVTNSATAESANRYYLKEALASMQNNIKPSKSETKALGCYISRTKRN